MIVISEEEAASRQRRSMVQDLAVHIPAEIVGELVSMMMMMMMMMMIVGGGASGRDREEYAGEAPAGDL